MKNKEFVQVITRFGGKMKLKAIKHGPTAMVVGGVCGMVAAVVVACIETKKATCVTKELKVDLIEIRIRKENDEMGFEDYDEKTANHDTAIAYAKAGFGYLKVYSPAIFLTITSSAMILCGHNILRKRNVALVAAYTAVDKNFKEYRQRVVDRFGEEIEKEIKYGIKPKDDKTQEISKDIVEKTAKEAVLNTSEYARFFDESCRGWTKDAEYNLMYVRRLQDEANEMLRSNGYVCLNDIYKMFGFEPTKIGQIVGWVYDDNEDNYIDFGVYNPGNERARAFVNGYERSILLDFNVNGVILDSI